MPPSCFLHKTGDQDFQGIPEHVRTEKIPSKHWSSGMEPSPYWNILTFLRWCCKKQWLYCCNHLQISFWRNHFCQNKMRNELTLQLEKLLATKLAIEEVLHQQFSQVIIEGEPNSNLCYCKPRLHPWLGYPQHPQWHLKSLEILPRMDHEKNRQNKNRRAYNLAQWTATKMLLVAYPLLEFLNVSLTFSGKYHRYFLSY